MSTVDLESVVQAAHCLPLEELEELKLEEMRTTWARSLGQNVRALLARTDTHRDVESAIRTDTKYIQLIDALIAERNERRK